MHGSFQAIIEGRGVDADGTVSSYRWRQISGPAAAVVNTSADFPARLFAEKLIPGSYVFSLRVTDSNGGTDTDYVRVEVVEPPNQRPVVDAGEDLVVVLPADSVALLGRGHDPDGVIASWKWTQGGGAACHIADPDSALLRVTDLQPGRYAFTLTATDDEGLAASDEVIITVTSPPTVNIGEDISVPVTAREVMLMADALDRDGVVREYRWSRHSGPDVRLEGVHSPSLKLTGLREGTYVFKVAVLDDAGAAATDHVTVSVWGGTIATGLTTGHPRGRDETRSRDEGTRQEKPREGLSSFTAAELRDCLVTVFNEAGEKIFSGRWSAGSFKKIFTAGGLYLYQIVREGERVDSGKIYIRH